MKVFTGYETKMDSKRPPVISPPFMRKAFGHGVVQPKLTVGAPNDIYEKEADQLADRVMRMPSGGCPGCKQDETVQTKPLAGEITRLVHRQSLDDEEEMLQRQSLDDEEEMLQRSSKSGHTPEVTPGIESDINSLKSGGKPLSSTTRSFFEPRFGADFTHVRVHTGSRAAQTAQSIQAKAFTTGNDIVFNRGQYAPDSIPGKYLLAHELTHVIQQNSALPGITAKNFNNAPIQRQVSEGETGSTYQIIRQGAHLVSDPARYSQTRIAKLDRFVVVKLVDKGEDQDFNDTPDIFKWWKVRIYICDSINLVGRDGWVMAVNLDQCDSEPDSPSQEEPEICLVETQAPPVGNVETDSSEDDEECTYNLEKLSKGEVDRIESEYRSLIQDARADGYNVAAGNLEHFLDGSGNTRFIPIDWLRSFSAVTSEENTNEERFETSLEEIAYEMSDGDSRQHKDYWDALVSGSVFTELFYASGDSSIRSDGDFSLSRDEDVVNIAGKVRHQWYDDYDWHAGLGAYIPGHGTLPDRYGLILQRCRGAKPFRMEAVWNRKLEGKITFIDYWSDDISFNWSMN